MDGQLRIVYLISLHSTGSKFKCCLCKACFTFIHILLTKKFVSSQNLSVPFQLLQYSHYFKLLHCLALGNGKFEKSLCCQLAPHRDVSTGNFLMRDLCNGGLNLPPPPSGWNRVKVSENLGASAVEPVSPVNTPLPQT
jgi:hypothetical protein